MYCVLHDISFWENFDHFVLHFFRNSILLFYVVNMSVIEKQVLGNMSAIEKQVLGNLFVCVCVCEMKLYLTEINLILQK